MNVIIQRQEKTIKRAFFLILVSFSSVLFSADKSYQDILTSEPVTLLDMMIYKNQLRASNHINNLDFDNVILMSNKVPFNYSDFQKATNLNTRKLAIPVTFPILEAEYLFDKNKFQFHLSGIWYLTEYDFDLNKAVTNKQLKNTMNNISNSCVALLRHISKLRFQTFSHAGYSTNPTRRLPKHKELRELINSDTVYKVTLLLGNDEGWDDGTTIICETNEHLFNIKGKDTKDVKFNYIGNWSDLAELEKKALKNTEH